ncbi:hypothetical protein [Actinomadura sp. DC4]|uniref:hypothetical protein n=1 Tax=Actinomadura sp. DC4 TaxID=3055069 RepID=UPI0025B054B8|nr:hypothetical protein [Actinomadura sp. DC4]MDN3353586.1 hypothetical protein [Actinomadura sp. DC4]
MHFHAYAYRGPGEAIQPFDDARRPGGAGFETATVPPEFTSAWLARPSRSVQGTWDEAAGAVEWMKEQYEDIADSRMHPELQAQAPSLAMMAETATDALRGGDDVVWAWWLRGGNYVELAVICCPNRHTDAPCPARRG